MASSNDVFNGISHSFRDRLRAAEAPTDMIDQLGGWTLKAVGQAYCDGYRLTLMVCYIAKVSNPNEHLQIEGLARAKFRTNLTAKTSAEIRPYQTGCRRACCCLMLRPQLLQQQLLSPRL